MSDNNKIDQGPITFDIDISKSSPIDRDLDFKHIHITNFNCTACSSPLLVVETSQNIQNGQILMKCNCDLKIWKIIVPIREES